MSKAINFVKGLSTVELAFLIKYQLPTYLPATREKINTEIRFSNFDFNEVEKIVSENEYSNQNPNGGENCPRYSSNHRFESEQEVYNSNDRFVFESKTHQTDIKKESLTNCMVCGYHDNVTYHKKDFKNLFS